MANVGTDFPPPSYSSLFFPFLIKAAEKKGVDLSEILRPKKSSSSTSGSASGTSTTTTTTTSSSSSSSSDKKTTKSSSCAKRWRTSGPAKYLLERKSKNQRQVQVQQDGGGGAAVVVAAAAADSTNNNNNNNVANNRQQQQQSSSSLSSSSSAATTSSSSEKKKVSSSSTSSSSEKSCLDDLDPSEMTLLQLLALNALDLTAPASDILLKNRKNNWVQLSGHEGAFAPAGPGTIWKKRTANDDSEVRAYECLMRDISSDLVPIFYKEVPWNGDYYIEMQDLLHDFKDPSVMDIKMGTRTFSECEVTNQKMRPDLYEKMIKIDPSYPNEEENRQRAITKLRYMTFREQQSSSSTLGFRIEALKLEGSAPIKDLKLVRTWEEVLCTMNLFLAGREDCKRALVKRFREMRDKLQKSPFFKKHEVVGSSILIVMDHEKAGAWMIDFAKTHRVPSGSGSCSLTHRKPWVRGNHEDGYLYGLDNLIKIVEKVDVKAVTPVTRVKSTSSTKLSSK